MFNETLVASLNHLLTMSLWELLALIALILVFASLTVKSTRTQREGLVFTLWGIAALFGLLVFRWLSAEPDFVKLLQASGLLPIIFVFATTGLILGAMSFGLWRIFFRPATRSIYLYSSTYSPWRVGRNGKKDGKVGASPKHYEESLLHFAEQNANLVSQLWSEKDKKLRTNYCDTLARRKTIQTNLAQIKENIRQPKVDYAREQEKYKSTHTNYHLGTGAYWFVIGLIGIAEFPFNLAAFRSILGEIELVNIFFSLVVSGIFAYAVHSLGQFFAEDPFEKGVKKVLAKNPIPLFSILFLALVIVGFAKFRESYIVSFQKQLGSYGIVTDINPALASTILGVVVTFFAILAIDVGRRRYRPEVAERRTALVYARKRFQAVQSEINKTEQTHQKLLKRFYKAEAERQSEFTFMQAAAETVNKKMQELVKIYRMHYERAAKKKRPNDSITFDQLPSVDIPESLRSLDKRCTT